VLFEKTRHLMREKLLQYFEISSPEIQLAVELIIGISRSKQVGATALSPYVSGDAKVSSKERKIERFYSEDYVKKSFLLGAIRNMFGDEKFVLSLDRTNWEFGESDINVFAAFASRNRVGSLLDLKMLDNKGGNSSSEDRIELLKKVIKSYCKKSIEIVLGDREFFSIKFAKWLDEKEIPYAIRLRENLEFIQPYLKFATKKGVYFANAVIISDTGEELLCDLSIKVLENEYLIVASKWVEKPLAAYRKRWEIERFFKMLKTGGLNLESSKMTIASRLEKLILMCSIAYLMCVKIGVFLHKNIKAMRWKKKDRCYEYSFFRYGLDWLKERFLNKITELIALITLIFPALQH